MRKLAIVLVALAAPVYAMEPDVVSSDWEYWCIEDGMPQDRVCVIWKTYKGDVFLTNRHGLCRSDHMARTPIWNPPKPRARPTGDIPAECKYPIEKWIKADPLKSS